MLIKTDIIAIFIFKAPPGIIKVKCEYTPTFPK
jgi:hypothetical protein